MPPGSFDVIIVGAGPAGSTLAYFLCKQQPSLKVLLLERKKFPRTKYCGDAFCAPALDIMERMEWEPGKSVLQEIEEKGLCRPVQRGGFISPFGHECINQETSYGSSQAVRTYAIKRVIADEYLARAAVKAGAQLWEECEAIVPSIAFDKEQECWRVPCRKGQEHDDAVILTGRVLVAADGATSYLARHLGLVTTVADATCSHRYVEGGTHNFTHADGVMFFNRSILPGYSAIFRHYNNDMYLGTYILPGGNATSRCLTAFEKELVDRHPYVRKAFGSKSVSETTWRVDSSVGETGRLQSAPIRCGGEKCTYGNHLLVIGDAAGQTDPLTGEGIHTAMIAAELAAETIQEMFARQNFSAEVCSIYQDRWLGQFGRDFAWSAMGAKIIFRFPILLDAACAYGRHKGQSFLDEFGLIMTGVKPKTAFLSPALSIPIGWFLVKEVFWQYIWGRKPLIPSDIGDSVITGQKHAKH